MAPRYGDVGRLPVADNSQDTFTFMVLHPDPALSYTPTHVVWTCMLLSGTVPYQGRLCSTGDIGPVRLTSKIVWQWDDPRPGWSVT